MEKGRDLVSCIEQQKGMFNGKQEKAEKIDAGNLSRAQGVGR